MPLMIQFLQLPLRDAPVSAWHDLHEGNYMLTVETAYTGREAWWYLLRQSLLKVLIGELATDSKLPPRC